MEGLGCTRSLTYCNFIYNLCSRDHLAHFTDEEIEAQGSELVGISVLLGFNIRLTG